MSSLSSHKLMPAALVIVSVIGCAHGRNPGQQPEAPPTVTSEDIQRTSGGDPIEKALMAKSPGVHIERTADGGISVRIRGANSINASNAPLYVVDGMAIETRNGSLTGINPYDIESIQVLKDAASTSMYGVRGANGVIIIKTKQAKR